MPMPSVMRFITWTMENLVVGVNDQPLWHSRIMECPRAGARLQSFKDEGIARVRVQMLTEQSLRLEEWQKKDNSPTSG